MSFQLAYFMKNLKHFCVDKKDYNSYFADKYQQHFLITYKALKDPKFRNPALPMQLQ